MISNQKAEKVRKYLEKKNIKLTLIFKTLSEVNRCKIFWMLVTEEKMSVSSAAKVLNISLPLASQHLKILLQNGLLKKEKLGQKVYYELNRENPFVKPLIEVVK
ncbi:MAG: metalloregulator ArsR/SmtB family transcription factor [Candidatus Doudnabacteria bacterium]|jgi:DNA-binding transcriptional ArsR family regulator